MVTGGSKIVLFKLTAELNYGGIANAKNVDTNENIKVIDLNHTFKGEDGYYGYAYGPGIFTAGRDYYTDEQNGCNGATLSSGDYTTQAYRIIQMQEKARYIQFMLIDKFGDSGTGLNNRKAANAAVNYFRQGRNPGTTVQVWDLHERYPLAIAGAKGIAVYDDRCDNYDVVECEQQVIWGIGVLANDLCSSGSNEPAITIKSFTPIKFGEFVLNPEVTPTYVGNPFGHAGKKDDKVLLQRTGTGWIITDISKKSAKFLQNLTQSESTSSSGSGNNYSNESSGNTCLNKVAQWINFESCHVPEEAGVNFGYGVEVVTSVGVKTEYKSGVGDVPVALITKSQVIKSLCKPVGGSNGDNEFNINEIIKIQNCEE